MDADFAGDWKDGDHSSPESVLSGTDFVIMFAGCPNILGIKLETEIALSTTESKYIALSTAMREIIPFMGLLKEISSIFELISRKSVFKYTIGRITTIALHLLSLLSSLQGPSILLLSIITSEALWQMGPLSLAQLILLSN